MCLPDSFGVVHVGETFTAYLGALNVSKTLQVLNLTVTAQLQTPTQRWHLASSLDKYVYSVAACSLQTWLNLVPDPFLFQRYHRGNGMGGVEVSPGKGVDTIVSHVLEEVGQHILRVEVGYVGSDGSVKTLRKFYRFQVSNPLVISETTFRSSDQYCYISISLANNGEASRGGLTICEAGFEPAFDLTAEQLSVGKQNHSHAAEMRNGARLFDSSGRLEVRQTLKYLFQVSSKPGSGRKGIAVGDELGKFRFKWRKACGEMGTMSSTLIHCPPLSPAVDPSNPSATMEGTGSPFVVHSQGKSGLSLDVAALAAARLVNPNFDQNSPLDLLLPVIVEPIHPPQCVELGVPFKVEFLVTNNSEREMTLQLQFHLENMKGISVCGSSFRNLQDVPGRGGSTVVQISFLPLATGLLKLSGCNIVDLNRGQSFPQPPLLLVFAQTTKGADQ
jgi:trafficking protein particle complex subunit 13